MIENFRNFLNEDQDPNDIEKVTGNLIGILMKGEEVEYIAVQKKPVVNLTPDCVVLTNKRIIFCRPKNLGLSMEFQDIIWKDIADCHMKEGILGAEFIVRTVRGTENKIDYLPKAQARKLYTLAQEQEEIQLEVRRQRDLEEKRAAAGNVTVSSNVPTHNQPIAQQEDPMATLQKLKSLFDNELISQAEYDAKKSDILSRL